jgi:hypothetical protein
VDGTATVAGGRVKLVDLGITTSGLEAFVDSTTLFTQGGNLDPAGGYYVSGGNVYADDFATISNNVTLRNGYSVVISAENANRTVTFPQLYPAN